MGLEIALERLYSPIVMTFREYTLRIKGFVLKNKINKFFHCRTKNYLYLYNVMRKRGHKKKKAEINLTYNRNWWDYGINPITGYERGDYVSATKLFLENRRQKKKYIPDQQQPYELACDRRCLSSGLGHPNASCWAQC